MASEHPAPEDLLLWQSGELDPHEAELIRAHAAYCPQCQERLNRHAQTYDDIAWVSGRAAQRRMHAAITERQHRRFTPIRFVTGSIAAILVVTVTVFTLDLTPSARAETLLEKAISHEAGAERESVSILLRSRGQVCELRPDAQLISLERTENHSNTCPAMTEALHRAGWTGKDVLSAKSFHDWRRSRHLKTDSINKLADTTEVHTKTADGPIQEAMLRLRNSDYHPVAARYEFAAYGVEPPALIEVEEHHDEPPVLLAHSPEPAPDKQSKQQPVASLLERKIDPLDEAEIRVRLALHHAGLDSDVLIDVVHSADAIRIWGVAPSDQAKAALVAALQNMPQLRFDVLSEQQTAQSPAPLPWTAWRGDTPPLAGDRLKSHFPNDPQGSQQFLNEIDATTRRLVAEARNRDALIALAARVPDSASEASAGEAAAQITASMHADIALTVQKLQPFLNPVAAPASDLAYPQAMQLYTLVHELFLMGRSQDTSGEDDVWAEVHQLLSGQ